MPMTRVPRRRLFGVTACLFAVGLAACGGGSSKSSSSTATTTAGSGTSPSGSGTTSNAKNAYLTDTLGLSHGASVPGIGDKAMRDAGDSSDILTSTKGDLYCSVIPQSDEFVGIEQLEVAAGDSPNIGDKYFAEMAAAIGTLCNRIYGSGNTTPDLTDLISAGASAASQPTTTTALTVPANFTLPTDTTAP